MPLPPSPVPTLSPLAEGTGTDNHNLSSFFSPQFSLEAQSPQLLSKEDTSLVGKGGGQQRSHSDVTSESTVLGTRLIVTSCPSVTSG